MLSPVITQTSSCKSIAIKLKELVDAANNDDVILLGVKGSTSGTTDEEKEWFL